MFGFRLKALSVDWEAELGLVIGREATTPVDHYPVTPDEVEGDVRTTLDITHNPGDLIATGATGGVGQARPGRPPAVQRTMR
ncbi:MAG: hypothetical protein WCJ73_01285 [Actinomycetes bacterium]